MWGALSDIFLTVGYDEIKLVLLMSLLSIIHRIHDMH